MKKRMLIQVNVVILFVLGLSSQASIGLGQELLDYLDSDFSIVATMNLDSLSKKANAEKLLSQGFFDGMFDQESGQAEKDFIANPEILGIDFTKPIVMGFLGRSEGGTAMQFIFSVKDSQSLIKFFQKTEVKSQPRTQSRVKTGFSQVFASDSSLLAIKGNLGIMLVDKTTNAQGLQTWLESIAVQASRKTSLLAKNQALQNMIKKDSDFKVWFDFYSLLSQPGKFDDLFKRNVAFSDTKTSEPDSITKLFKDSNLVLTLENGPGLLVCDLELSVSQKFMDQRLLKLMQALNKDLLKQAGVADLFMFAGFSFSQTNLLGFIQTPENKTKIAELLGSDQSGFDELVEFLKLIKGDVLLAAGGSLDRQGQPNIKGQLTVSLIDAKKAVAWLDGRVKKGDMIKQGQLWSDLDEEGQAVAPFIVLRDSNAYIFFEEEPAKAYLGQTIRPISISESLLKKFVGKSLVIHADISTILSFFADSSANLPMPPEVQSLLEKLEEISISVDAYQGNNILSGSMTFGLKDKKSNGLASLLEIIAKLQQ